MARDDERQTNMVSVSEKSDDGSFGACCVIFSEGADFDVCCVFRSGFWFVHDNDG